MKCFFTSKWSGLLFAFGGFAMMMAGIYRGEMAVVLKKAVLRV